MWPADLEAILGMTKRTKAGEVPFVYSAIPDFGGEVIHASEYSSIGRATEFLYGKSIEPLTRDKFYPNITLINT